VSDQTLSYEMPNAQRQHRCDNCWRVIEVGETYRRQTCVGDDGIYTHKSCSHCDALFAVIRIEDPQLVRDAAEGIELREWLEDTSHPLQEIFHNRWTEYGALIPVERVTASARRPDGRPEPLLSRNLPLTTG
jgi:hypothetical protein